MKPGETEYREEIGGQQRDGPRKADRERDNKTRWEFDILKFQCFVYFYLFFFCGFASAGNVH